MKHQSSRQKRALKQRVCAVISLIGTVSAAAFYMAFAYMHDMNADVMVQACMLGVVGVSVILSIGSLLVGVEA